MERNVGGTDRGARLVLGAALLATVALRYCPVNALLGLSSRRLGAG
jgi:hypothetical protein